MSPSMGVLVATLLGVAVATKDTTVTPVNQWPLVMVHDAATTYLEPGVVNNWGKTQQDGGSQGELDCGARAFDWRPKLLANGTLIMHHGDVDIHFPMSTALDNMVAWSNTKGQAVEDLIVLGITNCDGTGCMAAVQAALKNRSIGYVTDCSVLKGLTVAEAFRNYGFPAGGAIMAMFDCWEMDWEQDVTCSGFFDESTVDPENALTYTCYTDSDTKDHPLSRLWTYVDKITQTGPPVDGKLYAVQTLWQETDSSVVVSGLAGSTLLEDEKRSTLNRLLVSRIQSGAWNVSNINLVEVNNVCDTGPDLLAALRLYA